MLHVDTALSLCLVQMARAVAVFGFLTRDIVRRAIVRAERLAAELMEAIRCVASVAMAPAPNAAEAAKIPSVPKVAMIASPRPMTTLSGQRLEPADMSLGIRIISIGQPHRAVPITGATCLAIAVRIAGSLPNRMARSGDGPITIAHPSGTTVVDAAVDHADNPAKARAIHGAVYRTARQLFEGDVFYRVASTTALARRRA
jgi:2-methylaconitate isomerase